MQIKNSEKRWGSVSVIIHWISAVVIIAAITVGLWISTLEEGQPGAFELWLQLMPLHKSLGITALILVVMRFVWLTRYKVVPARLNSESTLTHTLATWAHRLLYFLIFTVPLMGWFASMGNGAKTYFWGWFLIPNFIEKSKLSVTVFYWVHFYLSWALVVLLVAHVVAAMWHHFVVKDNVLKRMLPFSKLP
ncbi:cytochrome b [Aestuariibacter sp. A3R04]|uniref:cytochrome b n=1 Tax=Aestuariibacter sp. A3R04 TaxID=2841571 RepID=UPI001C0914DB|nr:cytochrome b [Aestuariibacter sp. A3R04]MBU3023549.1 cytochrome b [Aestuariibacter sp. A3R04]